MLCEISTQRVNNIDFPQHTDFTFLPQSDSPQYGFCFLASEYTCIFADIYMRKIDLLEGFVYMGMSFTSNGTDEGVRVALENPLQARGLNQSIQWVRTRFFRR